MQLTRQQSHGVGRSPPADGAARNGFKRQRAEGVPLQARILSRLLAGADKHRIFIAQLFDENRKQLPEGRKD